MARGGRGGGRTGGGAMSRDVQVSKKLSWLLRHGAEKEGLELGRGGYVRLSDVLANRNIRGLKTSLDEIREIVATNEKQRFSLIHESAHNRSTASASASTNDPTPAAPTASTSTPAIEDLKLADDEADTAIPANSNHAQQSASSSPDDDDPSHYFIRANQGHSIALSSDALDSLLTPITLEADNLPSMVVHGTRHDAWPKIIASGGLKPMGRLHAHFAVGVPDGLQGAFDTAAKSTAAETDDVVAVPADTAVAAPAVLSGMRNSSTLLIYVNIRLALEKDIKFFMSDNGVVLSAGDENGLVPVSVFEKVVERGGNVLVENGAVVREMSSSFAGRGGGGGGGGGRGRGRGGRGRGRSSGLIVI